MLLTDTAIDLRTDAIGQLFGERGGVLRDGVEPLQPARELRVKVLIERPRDRQSRQVGRQTVPLGERRSNAVAFAGQNAMFHDW